MRRPALFTLSRLTLSLLTFVLLLAACAGQTADSAPRTASQPAAPTSDYQTPDYQTPDYPTPTPEPITLANTFGLTDDVKKAFSGAEKLITRAENGDYLVTAQVRNPETDELEEVQLTLDPASFNTHPEITNPLGLYTVDGYLLKQDYLKLISTPTPAPTSESTSTPDTLASTPTPEKTPTTENIKTTLLWLPETREFRLAYDLQPLYDGVNTSSPTLNPEAYQNTPTFTVDDIQSGFAVRNLLLDFSKPMAEGKTIDEILHVDPKATRNAWIKLGGNSLFFEQTQEGKDVLLKAKGNDKNPGESRYDNLTMKALPFGAHIEINGKTYFGFFVANFDPVDFDPAHPEQGADPKDPKNWKFVFAIPRYGNQAFDGNFDSYPEDLATMFSEKPTKRQGLGILYILLYGDETYQKNHPLLAQLLQIKGNDASQVDRNGRPGIINLKVNINYWINQLKKNGDVAEVPFDTDTIPPELQLMLFLFELGAAQ
jgi:hypothetical protein